MEKFTAFFVQCNGRVGYPTAMNLSKFGEKFTRKAGIIQLMDDLGAAMEKGDMLMLGGGNPAHILEVQARFRQRMMDILAGIRLRIDDRQL